MVESRAADASGPRERSDSTFDVSAPIGVLSNPTSDATGGAGITSGSMHPHRASDSRRTWALADSHRNNDPTLKERMQQERERRPSFFLPHIKPVQSELSRKMTSTDYIIFFGVLVVIITFSVFRYHAGTCQHARPYEVQDKCNHRIVAWYLGSGTLQRWMQHQATAMFIAIFSFLFPLIIVLGALVLNIARIVRDGWQKQEAAKYAAMALVTGALSGLVGIGGGLIFSPFFLCSGLEPAVAVATSSTCVIFTASSTTMQYLLTDRVIMSLVIIYGLANLIASYAGTKAVHMLQEKFGSRKSFISMIVFVGVVLSLVLAIYKFIDKLVHTFGPHAEVATATRFGWQ